MAIEHLYGDNVHISDSAWLRSLLARIGSPETPVQEVPDLVRAAYADPVAAPVGVYGLSWDEIDALYR